uniref:ATPase family AAA domain-containing protein 5 n=1 Tax=Ascaris lumbricoides TaxID=6252 RepID=A0A0M3I3C1_ASCLU
MPKEIIKQPKHMLEGNKSERYQHQKIREQSTITDDGGTDYEEESSSDSGRSTTFLETKRGSSMIATKLPLTDEPSTYIDSAMRKQTIKMASAAKTEGRKISVREAKQGHKISIKEGKKEYEGEHLNRYQRTKPTFTKDELLMKSNEEVRILKAEGVAKKSKSLRSTGESAMQSENSSDRKVKSGKEHGPTRAHMFGISKEKKSGMEKAPPLKERCEGEQQRAKKPLEENNKRGRKLKDGACVKIDKSVIRDAEQDKKVLSTPSEAGGIRKKEKKRYAEKPNFRQLQTIHATEEQGPNICGGGRSHQMLRGKCEVENTQESPPAKSLPEGRSIAALSSLGTCLKLFYNFSNFMLSRERRRSWRKSNRQQGIRASDLRESLKIIQSNPDVEKPHVPMSSITPDPTVGSEEESAVDHDSSGCSLPPPPNNTSEDSVQQVQAVCECNSDTDTDEGNFTSAEVVQKKVIATALPNEYMKLEAHEKMSNGTQAKAAQEKVAAAVLSEECLKHETLESPNLREEWCFNNGVFTSTESKECPLLSENMKPHDEGFAGGIGAGFEQPFTTPPDISKSQTAGSIASESQLYSSRNDVLSAQKSDSVSPYLLEVDYETLVLSVPACKTLELIQKHDLFRNTLTDSENELVRSFFSGKCDLNRMVEHALFRALDIAMTRVQEIDPGEDVMQFISNRNTAANLMFDAMKARKDYLPSYWISESNESESRTKHEEAQVLGSTQSDGEPSAAHQTLKDECENERNDENTGSASKSEQNNGGSRPHKSDRRKPSFVEEFSLLPPNV